MSGKTSFEKEIGDVRTLFVSCEIAPTVQTIAPHVMMERKNFIYVELLLIENNVSC